VEILNVTAPYELGTSPGFLYPAYLRALAYLRLGQGQQAKAEFEKMLKHACILGNFVLGPLAQLQLARAQAMVGDKAAAAKSYQDFLTLWKNADPDIPVYKQAKAESGTLQ